MMVLSNERALTIERSNVDPEILQEHYSNRRVRQRSDKVNAICNERPSINDKISMKKTSSHVNVFAEL